MVCEDAATWVFAFIWIFRIILDIFRYIIYNRVRMLTEIEASIEPGYIDRGMLCLGMILK